MFSEACSRVLRLIGSEREEDEKRLLDLVYQDRSVNCNREDDNICKKSPAACILGAAIGLVAVCVAPEIVIPGLALGGAAAQ